MTLDECIATLTEHNKWRRSETPYHESTLAFPPYDAKMLGQAIEYAIEELHRLKGLEK